MAGWFVANPVRAESLAERVIIVANSDDPDSLRLAQYYAEKRGIPPENIFSFKLPLVETIAWSEFVTALWRPLQAELIRRHWIDAIPMALTDAVGRQKSAMHGHRISYLVTCRGVPLRIAHDPALYAEVPPMTSRSEFRTNQGGVDSELALLAAGGTSINGFVFNALFRNDHPSAFDLAQVIKVGRLDGPDFDSARALVDHALEAEKHGLLGRGYVDSGGVYPDGDRWFESVATQLTRLGFETDVDRTPTTLPLTERIDAPAFYFGWYANDLNGPFTLPGFRFPAGAIALHLHSFSARTLHSATEAWCGPLVARGVTGTVGNVFEPYLQLTHLPHLFLRALARGDTLGDAACYALPALSWQGVLIGDPLYRPFAVSLEEQLRRLEELPRDLAGYAVLRRAHVLEAEKEMDEAKILLRRELEQRPNLAVALALAARLEANGDRAGVVQTLGFVSRQNTFIPNEWALARTVAQRLEANGAPLMAVAIYRQLFSAETMTKEVRAPWLYEARSTALAAQDIQQAEAWEKELDELIAPKPEAKE